MIEFTDKSYIIGMWFAEWSGCNWMCAVYRDAPSEDWKIRYRFRYFEDQHARDPESRRSWYHATLRSDTPEHEVEEKIEALARLIAAAQGAELRRLIVHGSSGDFAEMSQGSTWCHMRPADGEGARA